MASSILWTGRREARNFYDNTLVARFIVKGFRQNPTYGNTTHVGRLEDKKSVRARGWLCIDVIVRSFKVSLC